MKWKSSVLLRDMLGLGLSDSSGTSIHAKEMENEVVRVLLHCRLRWQRLLRSSRLSPSLPASPLSPDASADAEALWETALKIARMDGSRVAFVPEYLEIAAAPARCLETVLQEWPLHVTASLHEKLRNHIPQLPSTWLQQLSCILLYQKINEA